MISFGFCGSINIKINFTGLMAITYNLWINHLVPVLSLLFFGFIFLLGTLTVFCLLLFRSNEVSSQWGSWTAWYCMFEFIQTCLSKVSNPAFSFIRFLIGRQLNSVIDQGIQLKANCIFIGNEALVQIDFLVQRIQFSGLLFLTFKK